MKIQVHRGVCSECPENTMAAFRTAVAQNYDLIELDLKLTADGQVVVLHDETLNRTCRNADGSPLSHPVKISEITLREAQSYDAGLCYSVKYRGERIPLFSQVLKFAEETKIALKISRCLFDLPDEGKEAVFSAIRDSLAAVALTCPSMEAVRQAFAVLPNREIHYDGPVTVEILEELFRLTGGRFCAWLPLENTLTARCNLPKANPELCAAVKRFGALGLWILSGEEEWALAETLGADVIETTGVLKKQNPVKGFFDTHCHTEYSPDSKAPLMSVLQTAREKGLAGIAVTDHCELRKIPWGNDADGRERIRRGTQAVREFAKTASISVFTGVELGGGILFPQHAEEYVREIAFDNLIVTRHGTMFDRYDTQAKVDFSAFTPEELDLYVKSHYDDVLENVLTQNADIIAHLSSPLRYITGKYGIALDLADYSDRIDRILKEMIARGIALEANTSNLNSSSYAYNCLMPDRRIFERYRELGGYLVTLGSDAHQPDRLGNQFAEVWAMLREIGFPHLYYYKDRMAIPYDPQ